LTFALFLWDVAVDLTIKTTIPSVFEKGGAMNTAQLLRKSGPGRALLVFFLCVGILIAASVIASLTQRNFGTVAVTNVTYPNYNAIPIRAKLLKPVNATDQNPMPGVVYIHGYQNNRETGDAYCLELARRGFVVLNIDAIGRGNSGIPNHPGETDFDETYGGRSSLKYLQSLAFVRTDAVGMMGHSLGAEMAYNVALNDSGVRALVITGFAYTLEASHLHPKNMLMIIGKWDEFRRRMTGTRDIEKEWMGTPRTRQVIATQNPKLGQTYGDFALGTARRVFVPKTIHIQESHSRPAIAETLEWMRQALQPPEDHWIAADRQIWALKEWATLVSMLACLASLLPLGLMLLRTRFFSVLQDSSAQKYVCTRQSFFNLAVLNGLIMWLYLPLIFILFGIHVYLVQIDNVFPMMMVNGIIWWFLWINIIGFLIFRRWYKRRSRQSELSLADMGISYHPHRFALDGHQIAKTILLGSLLFAFAYLSEHLLESLFIVDFRFIFPFASDLTLHRTLLCLLYFPFILTGFVLMGIFLHGRLRRPPQTTWLRTFASSTLNNVLILIIPLILFLMIQYVPLFTTGFIPLVGPGGMFVPFIINLFHIIGVLIMVIPISTWFFQLTGKIYLGALVAALLVTWMFISSQVIGPIPI